MIAQFKNRQKTRILQNVSTGDVADDASPAAEAYVHDAAGTMMIKINMEPIAESVDGSS